MNLNIFLRSYALSVTEQTYQSKISRINIHSFFTKNLVTEYHDGLQLAVGLIWVHASMQTPCELYCMQFICYMTLLYNGWTAEIAKLTSEYKVDVVLSNYSCIHTKFKTISLSTLHVSIYRHPLFIWMLFSPYYISI